MLNCSLTFLYIPKRFGEFNMKLYLTKKTSIRIKTLILTALLCVSAGIFIQNGLTKVVASSSSSESNQEPESASSTLSVPPVYRYHYDNDFNYISHQHSEALPTLIGNNEEWSQNPDDNIDLTLALWHPYYKTGSFSYPVELTGWIFVKSVKTFEVQSSPGLGAYVDWKLDVDVQLSSDNIDIETVTYVLYCFKGTDTYNVSKQITLDPSGSQGGTFYFPYFNDYIDGAVRGEVRFGLAAHVKASVKPNSLEGITLSLKLQGLRVVQEIIPTAPTTGERTLFLVHGFSALSSPEDPWNWVDYLLNPMVGNYYGSPFEYGNVIVISYYHHFMGMSPDFSITIWTPIGIIASMLRDYIKLNRLYIADNVDFVCHSMGGLVIRYMIKHFYNDIKSSFAELGRNFEIKNVCTLATPNHGAVGPLLDIILLAVPRPLPIQVEQMLTTSLFLFLLNYPPEIPESIPTINWFTFAADDPGIPFETDGLVPTWSAPLDGAVNLGPYPLTHEGMRRTDWMSNVVLNELYEPPQMVRTILSRNIPGEIMGVDDLVFEPNLDEPGGTLVSVDLQLTDIENIDSGSVILKILSYYEMIKKLDTVGTYETELPLSDGWYDFEITADGLDGEDYYILGKLKIVDDDANGPEIVIEPDDLYLSDGDTIGGLEFEWHISDYSGISDASVWLDDELIGFYENQEGTIDGSYEMLTNEPGVYYIRYQLTDNDDDPWHDPVGEDRLSITGMEIITIFDDDTTEPEIDFDILEKYWVGELIFLRFMVDATDEESDIGAVDIRLGDYHSTQLGIHEAYFHPGDYDLSISVTDADNDREDDASTATLEKEIDLNPPRTNILIGDPNIPIGEVTHIKPETLITLITDDSMASTWYRFLGVWKEYDDPFTLGFSDGEYTLDYYSIDTVGNSEPINSINLALDTSAPSLDILKPLLDDALQDGEMFLFEATDLTGVDEIRFSIREPGGTNGIIIGPEFEQILAVSMGNDLWQYDYDTTLLPDGYYIIFAETSDLFGFYVSKSVQFSIRNWAVLELLPATERSRAGRTMPVKFSLRVAEAVDLEMPFVWNEELDIIIYDESNPSVELQRSTYGDTSLDYRISSDGELYITNFKTSKTPAVYIVKIWRKDMLIGSFEFETYKSKNSIVSNFYLLAAISLVSMLGLPYLLLISKKKLIII